MADPIAKGKQDASRFRLRVARDPETGKYWVIATFGIFGKEVSTPHERCPFDSEAEALAVYAEVLAEHRQPGSLEDES